MIFVISIFSYLLIKIYKSVALKYNIIDNPNRRSSHQIPTIRGAGIIFPIVFTLLVLIEQYTTTYFHDNWYFIIALILSSAISFIDDIHPQSIIIRSLIYLISLFLILHSANIHDILTTFKTDFEYYSAFIVLLIFLFGILNSYNFMDGINGLLASHVIINVSSLAYAYYHNFELDASIYYLFLPTLLIFSFYNFRKRAHFFAGDIGSISIAIILIFGIFQLISVTGNYYYLLFFATFLIDSWATIFFRLIRKEPLHKPHKSHLYQYLHNNRNFPFWKIAIVFSIPQIPINLFVILGYGKISILISAITLCIYLIYRINKQGAYKLFYCYDPDLFPKNNKESNQVSLDNSCTEPILDGKIQ